MGVALRVLLAAAGGTGGIVITPPIDESFTVDTITSPPEGGWVWFGGPRAIQNGDDVITGYLRDGGDVRAILIDATTRTVTSTTTLYDNFLDDDHEPPSFAVRADGKILAAFAYHLGPAYIGIGSSAGVLPAQAQVTNITSQLGTISEGVYGYTYGTIVYLPSEDTYYWFSRYHDSGLHPHVILSTSDDDGATWSAHTVVADITYHHVVVNGDDRIDLVMSDHPLFGQNDDPDEPTIIQHIYYDGTWHKSDGTGVTLPVANTGEATVVYDGSPDRAWLWGIEADGSGNPVIVFVVYEDPFSSGPWRYGYARWNGSSWVVNDNVADAGGPIVDPGASPEHGQDYAGGIAIDPANVNRILYSSDATGDFQVFLAETADGGSSWSVEQLTDDTDHNVRPVWIDGHGDHLQGLWLYGSYYDYFTYSQGIKGFGTATGSGGSGDWFGIADPWASRPAFGTYDEAPAGQMWLTGDQGGAIIENLTFSNRTAGVNVIVLDNVSNLTIRDIDFDEVPECIYAEGGGENVVIERIRARNIFGPYTRTAFHSGNLIQWKNPGPFTARDLKVKQDSPNPGGADWGTEDIVSLGGDTTWGGSSWGSPLLIERFAFDGGDWQSPSGTGFFVGDGDLVGGDGQYVIVQDGILLNPGQCAIGTGEQGPYRFQRIDIQATHGGENDGLQVRSSAVELGDINVDWTTTAESGAYTDLGGNDFAATLSLSVTL